MTTILIGLAPGDRGEAASHLGAMIARSTDSPLVVAAITPVPWPPSPFLGDEEYLELQQTAAQETLDRARRIIGVDTDAEYLIESARSVTDGLLEVSERVGAGLVVLGSGTSGLPGRVSLGSIAQRILHSLDTPVCFAPEGFAVAPDARISRITVGFGRADADSGLLRAAIERAQEFGIPLRVACFAVRPSAALRGTIETSAEDLVVGEWADQVRAQIRDAATDGRRRPGVAGHRRRRGHGLGGDDRHPALGTDGSARHRGEDLGDQPVPAGLARGQDRQALPRTGADRGPGAR